MTEKNTSRRGGARPNSGPKVNIANNLILYEAAIRLDRGVAHIRRLIGDDGWTTTDLVGDERAVHLRALAASKDGPMHLDNIREQYLKRRKKLGYNS
jgi:hypothetical protein